MKRQLCALAMVAILAGSTVAADQFYPISSVSSSTQDSDLWPVSNLIQGPGTGFNADAPYEKLAGGPDGLGVTDAPGGYPSDYIEVAGQPVITLDLGSDTVLNEISTWGYSSGNSNGVSEFSLKFSTDAEGPAGGSASAGPFVMAGDRATGTNDDSSRQSFDFDTITARYVELTVIDNFFVAPGNGDGGTVPGGDRAGLGEVAFQVVPEPSSAILLLIGCLPFIRRRR